MNMRQHNVLCYDCLEDVFPTSSIGGAPQIRVLFFGSSSHGTLLSRLCNTPLADPDGADETGVTASPRSCCRVLVDPPIPVAALKALCIIFCSSSLLNMTGGGLGVEADTGDGDEPVRGSVAVPEGVPVRARALASSSISSNTSCLTALME